MSKNINSEEVVNRIEFTKEMKKDYTILIPDMLRIHFGLVREIFAQHGYKVETLHNDGRAVIDEGLKYVHNDTCYPALLVIGQFIDALNSGKYDVHKTALIITQTGGGCRASNYIHLLRKALVKAGYAFVPVISLNLSGMEKNSGFKFTLPLALKVLAAAIYGDILMLLRNQTAPYEVNKGESDKLVETLSKEIMTMFGKGKGFTYSAIKRNLSKFAGRFAQIPLKDEKKTKVGVVGEIYVKYSPLANNQLEQFLESQNCEVMVPGLLGFIIFKADNRLEDIKLYGGKKGMKLVYNIVIWYLKKIEDALNSAVRKQGKFVVPSTYEKMKESIADVIGFGCKMGEGWLLTAEMIELIEHGYSNIVCAQPFGCLPNHIVGKGMIRKLREMFPDSNIVPVDYDPGATKVNQENRIKLMLAVANEKDDTKSVL